MKKVLIVEDDPMVALINRNYIDLIDGIEYAGCVAEEEAIIKTLSTEKIDLIVLDVYLPKKNGLEILKSFRSHGYLVDVIMVTAANSREEIKKAFAYGVIDYLVKPFEFERFSDAIKKYLSRDTVLNESSKLKQDDIDILNGVEKDENSLIPKGLNLKTLDKIIEFLEENYKKIWTIREIAAETNISNVTIKKYMNYLEEINKIKAEPVYGNIGRPEYNYIYIKNHI
ncbi:response regulator [Clostridium sp. 19966]|uniref:response regulator n=1 Tax=Clostridium sp. 19966 TaxID=2768166 RepID=UPI0028E03E27|nr:response regulator [Clostridium sp. 19966]MDT8715095.1 response regulator [Clostridium sp. 19966]